MKNFNKIIFNSLLVLWAFLHAGFAMGAVSHGLDKSTVDQSFQQESFAIDKNCNHCLKILLSEKEMACRECMTAYYCSVECFDEDDHHKKVECADMGRIAETCNNFSDVLTGWLHLHEQTSEKRNIRDIYNSVKNDPQEKGLFQELVKYINSLYALCENDDEVLSKKLQNIVSTWATDRRCGIISDVFFVVDRKEDFNRFTNQFRPDYSNHASQEVVGQSQQKDVLDQHYFAKKALGAIEVILEELDKAIQDSSQIGISWQMGQLTEKLSRPQVKNSSEVMRVIQNRVLQWVKEPVVSGSAVVRLDRIRQLLPGGVNHFAYELGLDKVCASCFKKDDSKPLFCSQCKVTHYCSRECQTKHWKYFHKKVCISDVNRVGYQFSNLLTAGNITDAQALIEKFFGQASLLSINDCYVKDEAGFKKSLLDCAIDCNQLSLVQILINRGADVNFTFTRPQAMHYPPLMYAVDLFLRFFQSKPEMKETSLAIIKHLIASGADVNFSKEDLFKSLVSPLSLVLESIGEGIEGEDIFDVLVQAGARLSKQGEKKLKELPKKLPKQKTLKYKNLLRKYEEAKKVTAIDNNSGVYTHVDTGPMFDIDPQTGELIEKVEIEALSADKGKKKKKKNKRGKGVSALLQPQEAGLSEQEVEDRLRQEKLGKRPVIDQEADGEQGRKAGSVDMKTNTDFDPAETAMAIAISLSSNSNNGVGAAPVQGGYDAEAEKLAEAQQELIVLIQKPNSKKREIEKLLNTDKSVEAITEIILADKDGKNVLMLAIDRAVGDKEGKNIFYALNAHLNNFEVESIEKVAEMRDAARVHVEAKLAEEGMAANENLITICKKLDGTVPEIEKLDFITALVGAVQDNACGSHKFDSLVKEYQDEIVGLVEGSKEKGEVDPSEGVLNLTCEFRDQEGCPDEKFSLAEVLLLKAPLCRDQSLGKCNTCSLMRHLLEKYPGAFSPEIAGNILCRAAQKNHTAIVDYIDSKIVIVGKDREKYARLYWKQKIESENDVCAGQSCTLCDKAVSGFDKIGHSTFESDEQIQQLLPKVASQGHAKIVQKLINSLRDKKGAGDLYIDSIKDEISAHKRCAARESGIIKVEPCCICEKAKRSFLYGNESVDKLQQLLRWAALQGHIDMVEYLCEVPGVNINELIDTPQEPGVNKTIWQVLLDNVYVCPDKFDYTTPLEGRCIAEKCIAKKCQICCLIEKMCESKKLEVSKCEEGLLDETIDHCKIPHFNDHKRAVFLLEQAIAGNKQEQEERKRVGQALEDACKKSEEKRAVATWLLNNSKASENTIRGLLGQQSLKNGKPQKGRRQSFDR